MSGPLHPESYADLVNEDIEWLLKQPRTLERDHVIAICKDHVEIYRGDPSWRWRSRLDKLNAGHAEVATGQVNLDDAGGVARAAHANWWTVVTALRTLGVPW